MKELDQRADFEELSRTITRTVFAPTEEKPIVIPDAHADFEMQSKQVARFVPPKPQEIPPHRG